MSDDPTDLQVGVVGLGGMGNVHANNAEDVDATVVAGADVVPDSRAAFAETFDAATYEDHEAMYEAEDLDAVFVTTPNKFHAPAAVGALDRDVSVLCEKPLANTLANAADIVAAAEASDGFAMVGFHNRFSTAGELFVAKREAGYFGELSYVNANYIRRRGIPGVGSWFTNKELSGGGALIDIGVHALDFSLYLLDFPEIVEVSGVARSMYGGRPDYADPDDWAGNWETGEATFDVDDSVTALIRCADGQTVSLDAAWASEGETDNSVTVWGTDGGAAMALGGGSIDLYSTGRAAVDHYVDTTLEGNLDPSGHRAQDERFLRGVAAGEAPDRNTVEQAYVVQQVIDAIYRSSESGRAVSLAD